MNYQAKYTKQKLQEKASELAQLQGAEKVALEEKIIMEAEAELKAEAAEVVSEAIQELKEEVKKKGKK